LSYPCPIMRTLQIPTRFISTIHYLPRSTVMTLKRSFLNGVDAHLSAEYLIHSLLSHTERLQPRDLMARVNRARSRSLARGIVNDLWVALTRGGTRPGEEVRDGSHGDNRCGGNRCGITPTAAPLRPQAGALRGPGPLVNRATGEERYFCCPFDRCGLAPVARTVFPRSGKGPSPIPRT
jgi:hypothetical protein